MKNLLIVLAVVLAICACGNKNGSKSVDKVMAVDSIAIKDSIAKADSVVIVSYLEKLYDLVLNQNGNEQELTSHFSDEVKKRLLDANDYDDGSMALWELRTGAQDGSSDVSKVKRITKDKDWYVVYYVDMGMEGATKLKVAVINGKILVSDYKRVSLGSTSNL